MRRDMNINKREALKHELKIEFPNITDAELNTINGSYDKLIDRISVKTNKDRKVVEKIVEQKVEYVNSKHII